MPRLIASDHTQATTQIVLPLRADRAEVALKRARDGLAASGAKSLLFLRNIRRLERVDGENRGSADATDLDGSIRSIHSMMDGISSLDRFLVLSRPVEHQNDRKQYGVKAALRLNGAGDLVAEEAPTRLMVFFGSAVIAAKQIERPGRLTAVGTKTCPTVTY